MIYLSLSSQLRAACIQPAISLRIQRSGFRTLSFGSSKLYHNTFSSFSRFSISSTPPSASRLEDAPMSSLRYRKLYQAAGLAGLGLGLSLFGTSIVHCEPVPSSDPVTAPPRPPDDPLPPPPQSSVNFYELTFGTVCGICAGVFVKKGAKMLAFVLGGVFVLLQYLNSLNLLRVNWTNMGQRFENAFYTRDAQGVRRPPNVGSLFRWIVDFLTSDFQPRASFIAGLALGLRIG
ncbi:unnamed protein product [Somion occarium]|uniref:FUN14 family protein n=1 Tax=Somion occarium TaxID=3059160 RepID=A0ABP1DAN8_9APHY